MSFNPSFFDEIDAQIKTLDIDEIKRRLQPHMVGLAIKTPIFDPGAFVYRARALGPRLKKQDGISLRDLIYPPADKMPLGRLNRPGNPVFYGAINKQSVFFELANLKAGDELILTFWKTTEKMLVNNVGYTQYAFEQLGARRAVPDWSKGPQIKLNSTQQTMRLATISNEVAKAAMAKDSASDFHQALSKYFARQVGPGETDHYKLTVAIGELHLGEIKNAQMKFAGILYPSVRMWANGDNVGLLPWFVDDHLEFRKAVHVRIKERRDTALNIDYIDMAREFDEAGHLKWLGRIQKWSLKPGGTAQAVVESGPDADGDYEVSKDGQLVHWKLTDVDTGKEIQPD